MKYLVILKDRDAPEVVVWQQVDMARIEARVLAEAMLSEAIKDIVRRAGLKSGDCDLYFAHLPTQPPRMQWVSFNGAPATVARPLRRKRQVIVGQEWLQKRAPELWCAFVSARLMGLSLPLFAPTMGDNFKRI